MKCHNNLQLIRLFGIKLNINPFFKIAKVPCKLFSTTLGAHLSIDGKNTATKQNKFPPVVSTQTSHTE